MRRCSPVGAIAGIGRIVRVIAGWSSIGIVSPDGMPPMTGASGALRGWYGAGLKAPSSGTVRPSVGACSRSRLQVPVMKAQASAGRATCGVVRTATPVPRPRSRPCVTRVLAEASGSSRRLRFGQGPARMSSCTGFSAVAIACPGSSPTMMTPSRLLASSVLASAWRCALSASASVV